MALNKALNTLIEEGIKYDINQHEKHQDKHGCNLNSTVRGNRSKKRLTETIQQKQAVELSS